MIGQVHLSGWFVAVGLAIGTAVAEWGGSLARSRHWHWWLLGTLVGLLSAVPWAMSLARSAGSLPKGAVNSMIPYHVVGYLHGFVATATSLFPFSALGLGYDTASYMVGPVVDGIPTHVPDVLSWFTFLAIVVRILARLGGAFVIPGLRWTIQTLARRVEHRQKEHSDRPECGPAAAAAAQQPSPGFYLWSTVAIPSASSC